MLFAFQVNDMVQEVRVLADEVSKWAEHARPIINSGKKLDMPTVKALLESGEKLKVNTDELRTLRAAMKAVRKWMNKVKKCDLDQGDTNISTVTELINEHDSLLIEMPDDLARLQQATQAYCICRRPYEGFMIGCDECGEWYHGPCIGVSQARADRFDKFVCVRCSMKNLFKNSAVGAVEITKKWSSRKCLKKARQVEHQKHQRKVRKETKDMEKLQAKLEKLEKKKEPASKVSNSGAEEGGNATGDLIAEKPADKPAESVIEQPGEASVSAVIDRPTDAASDASADETSYAGSQIGKAAQTLTESSAESIDEPSSEKPRTSPEKSDDDDTEMSAEVTATENEKPQGKSTKTWTR